MGSLVITQKMGHFTDTKTTKSPSFVISLNENALRLAFSRINFAAKHNVLNSSCGSLYYAKQRSKDYELKAEKTTK